MNYVQKKKLSQADILFQKAFTAHHANKLEEAEKLYRQALRLTPKDIETNYFLGTVCSQQGKFDEALKYLNQVLTLEPGHAQTLNSLGLTYRSLRKLEEAENCFRRALETEPDFVEALSNLGSALEVQGKLDEAEPLLQRALAMNPDLANIHYNLGLVASARDRFEEAARHFVRGLQLKPDYPPALSDLSGIYKTWGRFQQSLECIDRALELVPNSDFFHNNRGAVLEELGRTAEAIAAYKKAEELNPANHIAKWNTAYLYLRQGILDLGWEMHELRLKEGGQVSVRFPFTPWDGSDLSGKTVLVYAEQGVGDEIFYASCIPDVIARAKHCIIECDRRLEPLFKRSFPTATVVGGERLQIGWVTEVPKIDVQSAVGSLPLYLRRTIDSFPKKPDYLVADTSRREFWRSRLALLGPGMKVGICWRSGLTKGIRHRFYSRLSEWGEIFGVDGIQFINLQYDDCEEELREAENAFGVTITNFPDIDLKNDLDETAALISSLDVVISAGTAVSEISGGLGVTTFRLDPHGRQMDALGTKRLPWHPATRLFAQLSIGDWSTPIALVAEALKEKALGIERAVEYVSLPGGVEVAVEGFMDDLTTYVLKEQGAWFDPEYDFVLGMARPGMRILDIGSGPGVYAIPLSVKICSGKLWAVTHAATDANLMMHSRTRNKVEASLHVSLAEHEVSLDAEMDKHGLDDIAFVRVATQVFQSGFVSRSSRFLAINSPLLMFGFQTGATSNFSEANQLLALGYALYRFVPGLKLLVPVNAKEELDVYTLNVFACKPDRAEALERQGLLVRTVQQTKNFPGIAFKHWQEYLSGAPYSREMYAQWIGLSSRVPDWEVYWMALNMYALAKSIALSQAERYANLVSAGEILTTLVRQQANLPRLLSLTRILIDLGRREIAVNLLNQICSLLNSGMQITYDEPFLALSDKDAAASPGAKVADWMIAMILEQRESLRAFSTFFTNDEGREVYEEVNRLGFGSAEVDKRLELIRARVNKPIPG